MKATSVVALFCLLLLFTYGANAEVIGWWRFEEGSGNEVEDSSGNGLTAVVTEGNLGWEKADLPPANGGTGACEFDGKTSLEVKTNPLLNVSHVTIEAWVKQKEISVYQPIIFRDPSYTLNGSGDGDVLEIPYGYVWIGGKHPTARGKDGLPQNQWAHVALTYDGSVVIFWLNGEEIARNEERKGDIDSSTATLYIGGRTGAAPDRHFIGLIDEAKISDEALKPDEFLFKDAQVSSQGKLATAWGALKQ